MTTTVGATPLFDRLLVETKRPKPVTDSGLVIPETVTQHHVFGTVLALGLKYDGPVKVGDQVLITEAGTGLRWKGDRRAAVIDKKHVVAVVKEH